MTAYATPIFCSWLTTIQVIQLTWSEHSIVTSQCCTRQIAVQRFDCDEQMNGQTYMSVSIRVVLPHGIRRRVYCDSLILYNVDWLALQYFRHSGFCSVRVSKRVSTWAATGFLLLRERRPLCCWVYRRPPQRVFAARRFAARKLIRCYFAYSAGRQQIAVAGF